MLLYIIRHGDPDYDNDCLTYKGKEQATALSKRFAVHGLDALYASPLGRAVDTAKPTAGLLKLDIKIEEWMSETLALNDFCIDGNQGYKEWVFGCPAVEMLKDGNASRADWYNHHEIARCKTAKKGYQRIQQESDAFIKKLGYQREGSIYKITEPNENRVAVFCHGGMGMIWLSYLLSMPPLAFWAGFDIPHSGVTILSFANHANGLTAPRCLAFSDLSHLYGERLPMQFNNDLFI